MSQGRVIQTEVVDSRFFVVRTECGQAWPGMRHTEDVKIISERAMDHSDTCPVCRGRSGPRNSTGLVRVNTVARTDLTECGAWCGNGPGGLCARDRGHDGEHGPADNLVSCARCGQPLSDDNCPDECPC